MRVLGLDYGAMRAAGMKMVFYVLIGAGVFAAADLAQALFGVSLGRRTTSSLEPTGFALSRFLLQTLAGGLVGTSSE